MPGSLWGTRHRAYTRASAMSMWERSTAIGKRLNCWGPRMSTSETALTASQIEARIKELGQWFHNIDLNGVKTAPDHFLGDYPNVKWQSFSHAISSDLSGRSVLDIGCNAGFYAIEMKRRGANRVVGIDSDDDYLKQARFAAEVM